MILGMCSVTFADEELETIMPLAQGNSLKSVEWSSRFHVKPLDMAMAVLARKRSRHAGFANLSYGSYYRIGCPAETQEASFEDLLLTAEAMKADQIRIWAGDLPSAEVDASRFQAMLDDLRRIYALASAASIDLILEFHANTYTDTAPTALHLLESAALPRLTMSWQPPVGRAPEDNLRDIALLCRYIDTIHVFAWDEHGQRYPLADQKSLWQDYVACLRDNGYRRERYLLEFVKDNDLVQFSRDVSTLRAIVGHDFL